MVEQRTPADGPVKKERKRIPLTVPQRKLEVPGIPGYYCRWFRGTASRLAQAERAGYEFVQPEEIELNELSVGGDAGHGSTDMGGRVSVTEGSEEDGQAVRLYLMKQALEFYHEDRAVLQERNDQVAVALTSAYTSGQVGGQAQGETSGDLSLRYVDPRRTRIPDLFRKKT